MPPVKRSPRNSVNDRPSGWRLALRRQRRLLKPLAIGFGACIAAIAVVGTISSISAKSGRTINSFRDKLSVAASASGLRVDEIRYEGYNNTPRPLLEAALGIHKGDPILGFSLEDARANLERIPWVEKATVERRLPSTIVVNIEERAPVAVWQNQGKISLVDAKGQVVTNEDLSQFRYLPRIVGSGAPAAADALLAELRKRPELADKVNASVRVGDRRWNLHLNSGTDVLLPEGHEAAAMDRLVELQKDDQVLDRPLVAIDMRLPDRLVFRPKDAPKDAPKDSKGQPVSTQPVPVPPPVPPAAKKPT